MEQCGVEPSPACTNAYVQALVQQVRVIFPIQPHLRNTAYTGPQLCHYNLTLLYQVSCQVTQSVTGTSCSEE